MFLSPALSHRCRSLTLLCLSFGAGLAIRQPMAYAQAATGALTGFVVDPDQAAIPGATVTLTPASGSALTTKSGGDGNYSFRNVPAGTYSLTVTMNGFASFVREGIRVGAAPIALNARLVIQTESQEINVTAQNVTSVSVDPDQNGSSVVIKDKDLEALSDDPDELSDELSALAGPSAGPNGGQIYVDGFTGGQLPPKSSIREIRVNQNPFSAQFDKQGFGRVEVFTKPGTDSFHGTGSVQGNANFLNTSNPFLGSDNIEPAYHRIFFIGSLTGPLTKTSSFSLAGSHRTIQDDSIFAGEIISTGPGSPVLCPPGDQACSVNSLPGGSLATFHPQTRWDLTPRFDLALGKNNTLTARYQFEDGTAQNAGLGSTSLNTTAYSTATHENQVQISDTQILSQKVINETRLQLVRTISSQSPNNVAATVTVPGLFTGGGSGQGTQNETSDHVEVQNYTSIAMQKNFIRLGGRYRLYREALLSTSGSNGTFTYGPGTYPCGTSVLVPCPPGTATGTPVSISATTSYQLSTPSQYKVTSIVNASVEQHLSDVGIYAEDDWRAKPNLTLSYGIRYEAQGQIHSHADLAPRVAVSYGIPRKKGNPLTVVRTGFGLFYDRFSIGDTITTLRQNGVNQVQEVFDPAVAGGTLTPGCGPTNTTVCGNGSPAPATIYQFAPNLRSAYNMQYQVGVDQQAGKRSTISFNYLGNIGVHQYLSRVVPRATPTGNLVYQYSSGGVFREEQFILNFRTQLSNKLSLFGFYAYSHANSNANGADSFPTDSVNPRTDYGRALFIQANRIFLFGNYQGPFGINVSPLASINSGNYYNITSGIDNNGDSEFNDRAGFANGVSGNCRNGADFINGAPGSTPVTSANRVPPGYCTGPPNVTFNARIVKAFGFGKRAGSADAQGGGGRGAGGPGGFGGGGPRGGGGGGPRGGGGGGAISSGHKYNFNIGAQINNLFNYVPYSTPNGSLSAYTPNSPATNLFGKSTSLSGGLGGGGGQGNATPSAVRTITLQLNFNF